MKYTVVAVGLAAGLAASAHAQSIRAADSLLERGRLQRAESLYYAAARVRPRDPVARWALGRFLAARGAQRVAATLFEEALQFGGDATTIAADLAPIYLALGDYHALATLASSPLTSGERSRVAWLEAHPSRVVAPDSVLSAILKPSSDSSYLGVVPIRLNGHVVDARIDAASRGIILSDSMAGVARLHMFTEKEARVKGTLPAAADSVGIGRLIITNAPVTVGATRTAAILGLDMLARFAPTLDVKAGRVTLRVSGSVAQMPTSATVLSTLVKPTDWVVLQANGWISMRDASMGKLLRDRRWTLDAKRGQIVLE